MAILLNCKEFIVVDVNTKGVFYTLKLYIMNTYQYFFILNIFIFKCFLKTYLFLKLRPTCFNITEAHWKTYVQIVTA